MRNIKFILPTKWAELSNKQLLFVSRLFLSKHVAMKYKFLTYAALNFLKIKIKKIIDDPLGIPEYILKKKGERIFILKMEQVHFIASKLEWILDEVTELLPLKRIRFANPCNSRMYNTPFIQFITAEIFYTSYKQTGRIKDLDNLVATIYQKKGQKFNDKLVKKRAKYFRWSSTIRKYTVFLWYSGFRHFLSIECPYLFNSSGKGEELTIKKHVLGMIRGLTDGDVTKSKAVQFNTETMEALHELDAKSKHVIEMKEKMKTSKS